MNCIKCEAVVTPSSEYDHVSSHCEDCNEISVKRYKQREEWRAWHDEPCPEAELTQFPKPGENR